MKIIAQQKQKTKNMSKKTKPVTTPVTTPVTMPVTPKKDMAQVRAARDEASKGDRFVYLGMVKEGTKKLAPQAQVIVNAIQAAGKKGVTRAELVDSLKGVLVTRQPEGRILSYYQTLIIDTGYIAMTKVTTVAPTPEDGETPEDTEDTE